MTNKIYEWIKYFIKNYLFEIIFLLVVAFISFYKFPYIIYKPGGSIDISSRIEIDNKSKINGSYSMNYVTVSRGSLLNIILSYFIKDWQLEKEENITLGYEDYETSFKIEQLEYKNAIFLAIYNACKNDNCKITINSEESYVIYIDENADTDINILDKIDKIDGKSFAFFSDLREYITSKNVGDRLTIEVINDGKSLTKYATVYEKEGVKLIGLSAYNIFDYETEPHINIKTKTSEAGPSGGLMLTLALYDYLTDVDMAKNRKIMGTGTIDEEGNVGAIGGIKYKMLGAKKDKADLFLVPIDNCEEANKVKEEYNIKYDIKCVKTFEEVTDYLLNN